MFGFSTVIPEFWNEVLNVLDSEDRFGRMVIIQVPLLPGMCKLQNPNFTPRTWVPSN